MIDISDGLGRGRRPPGGGERPPSNRLERVPVAPEWRSVAGGDEAAVELAASGGEDFELLLTVAREHFGAAAQAVAMPARG